MITPIVLSGVERPADGKQREKTGIKIWWYFLRRISLHQLFFVIVAALTFSGTAVAGDQLLPFGLSIVPEEMRSDLPLPFGVSVQYLYVIEKLNITNFEISVNGQKIPPSLVKLTSLKQRTQSVTGRIDAWVLPFFNLYCIGGYVTGTASNLKLVESIAIPFSVPSKIDYQGSVFGAGTTLAWGYGPFLMNYDVNYTWTQVNMLDTSVQTLVQGIRAGYQRKVGDCKVSLYGGGLCEGIQESQRGSTTMGGMNIKYSLKARAACLWNPLVGTQVEFGSHGNLKIEGGFGGRKIITTSCGIRF
jgi:hypothetical protein